MTSALPPTAAQRDDDHPTLTDKRLIELEIKQSYSDDLLEELNLMVFKQQAQIDNLAAQVQRLQQSQARGTPEEGHDPRAELPPHY